MVHNESSTAVLNDVEAVGGKARGGHSALLVVDAVSSLGGGTRGNGCLGRGRYHQRFAKCLMTPPGTAFIAVSPKAREYMENCKASRYYFDLRKYEQFIDRGVKPPLRPILITFLLWKRRWILWKRKAWRMCLPVIALCGT